LLLQEGSDGKQEGFDEKQQWSDGKQQGSDEKQQGFEAIEMSFANRKRRSNWLQRPHSAHFSTQVLVDLGKKAVSLHVFYS